MAPLQSKVGARPEKPAGHVPSSICCDGLISTGEDIGPLVAGLCDTGDEDGKKVGLNDCGALDG